MPGSEALTGTLCNSCITSTGFPQPVSEKSQFGPHAEACWLQVEALHNSSATQNPERPQTMELFAQNASKVISEMRGGVEVGAEKRHAEHFPFVVTRAHQLLGSHGLEIARWRFWSMSVRPLRLNSCARARSQLP